MNLSIGIVGLPNSGKSTLFNALTNMSVPAENYPFTTIEPNVGIVPLKDLTLKKIAKIEDSQKITPATIKFVDIAGLVKGASKGEGLGNKFLANIREVDAILHMIRAFEDEEVVNEAGKVDLKRDREIIETELIIKDTETLEKKLREKKSKAKSGPQEKEKYDYLKKMFNHLNENKLANSFPEPSEKEIQTLRKDLFLLTDKPILYAVNFSQEKIDDLKVNGFRAALELERKDLIVIDARFEEEMAELSSNDRKDLSLDESSIDKLVDASFRTLSLITFFTANEDEARATNLKKGSSVVKAAGAIHTDFAKNFIAAEVIGIDNFLKYGGWRGCKEKGKIGLEGRDYIVKDKDVVHVRYGKS